MIGPAIFFCFGLIVLYVTFSGSGSVDLNSLPTSEIIADPSLTSSTSATTVTFEPVKPVEPVRQNPRYAITSSVQTHNFMPLALMLGYSIKKHNDVEALDAEMVLLVREQSEDAKDGITPEDKVKLEEVGWKLRPIKDLEFKDVKIEDIRAHHRHNMNKLELWNWTEYEKILFIDADVICKGSFKEVFDMPGDFAAAPDVWWDILHDTRFNSGVIVFRPSKETFADMVPKVSDPRYHKPNEADQAFLNEYYKFRYFGLPYKYNFNLVMYQYHKEVWDMLWDEAVFVHMTMRKPQPAPNHCHEGCNEKEPSEWYAQNFEEMIKAHGWVGQVPVYG